MKTRILVVDDEKTITDLVGIYLRNEGYEVQLAYNGADAAQAILTQEFDLAILDIMLPDMGLRWESWTKAGQEESRMYSQGQRKRAIETFIKFDHSYADTVAELGY
ncbi:response regulator, partial [Enorma massiliensis]|uniref:response regulator n=1 Tax=Enorma massiliensis TaxID=1472761 RepID=UPI003A93C1D6